MRPLDALTRHASSWGRLVTISVFAVLTAALVMAVWWAATTEERTGTYIVRGTVNGITLDIGDADLDIIGGGTQAAPQVSRTDRFAFGHPAEAERVVRGGTLRLRSRCPAALIGSCSSSYRLRVPDNVPVTVRTTSGNVSSSGYRGSARVDTTTGDVSFNSWCGFNLQIRADAGDVRAVAACSPERLQLRSRQGRVDALVPPGRYRVDAESDEGTPQRPRGHRRGRRAVPDPGALDDRRRERRERAMTTGPAAPDSIDFARRLKHAGEALEYLTLSLPLALVCALTTAVLVLGAALSAIWIGLPLVLAAVAVCARLAEVERRQANRLLDAHIPPLPAPTQHTGTLWRRALASLTDRAGLARARVRRHQGAAVDPGRCWPGCCPSP